MSSVIDRPILAAPERSPLRAGAWRPTVLIFALAVLVWLLLFRQTAWSMAAIWMRSETFAHGFLILPMSVWMIYSKRQALAALAPQPCWAALVLLIGAGLAWLVGESAGVMALSQSAVVAMLIVLVWALFGTAVFKTILFPLGFLFFMVPIGEFLMTPLINQTADFVVAALQYTGVPVYREGNTFAIPNGNWSVVEACSGLRYLIASITLGCLFAYLSYRTMWRRVAFIGAAILVPILANWLRAYLIVMLGYLSSNKLATGVDHIIYGWVFFGLVMLVLFWVGSIWREDLDAEPMPESAAPVAVSEPDGASPAASLRLIPVAVAALAILLVWQPALSALEQVSPAAAPQLAALTLPDGAWQVVPEAEAGSTSSPSPSPSPFTSWAPHYQHPRAALAQTFKQADGQPVSLFVGYYNRQHEYDELVTYNNQIVMITDKQWTNVGERQRSAEAAGQPFSVVEAQVRGAQRLLAWRWYWINGRLTDNDYVAKALIALNMLTGRGDESAVVLVYTPAEEFKNEAASERLRQFVTATWPSIAQRLDGAASSVGTVGTVGTVTTGTGS